MRKRVNLYDCVNNKSETIQTELDVPSSCPHCGYGIDPQILKSYYLEKSGNTSPKITKIFLSLLCPQCERLFGAEYFIPRHCYEIPHYDFQIEHIATFPVFHRKASHPEKIESFSPKFVQIYNESYQAEESGLHEICGMGYRKALEFLIKDYAIMQNPDNKADIESKMLGKCIEEYIDNAKIKSLAKASAWIGNDQTHYVMRNPDYNVGHLKAFIAAVESYINSELEVIEANKLISPTN